MKQEMSEVKIKKKQGMIKTKTFCSYSTQTGMN